MIGIPPSPDSIPFTPSRLKLAATLAAALSLSGCAGDDAREDPCAVDKDCLRGEFCDVVELQCMPEPEECREDLDCRAGEVCAERVCGSENMTTDATTTEGTTGSGTDTTDTGTTGETDGVECVEDLDCGEGEVCDQNVCVPEMEDVCEGVICGENASCNGGECECDEGFEPDEEGVCEEVSKPTGQIEIECGGEGEPSCYAKENNPNSYGCSIVGKNFNGVELIPTPGNGNDISPVDDTIVTNIQFLEDGHFSCEFKPVDNGFHEIRFKLTDGEFDTITDTKVLAE